MIDVDPSYIFCNTHVESEVVATLMHLYCASPALYMIMASCSTLLPAVPEQGSSLPTEEKRDEARHVCSRL